MVKQNPKLLSNLQSQLCKSELSRNLEPKSLCAQFQRLQLNFCSKEKFFIGDAGEMTNKEEWWVGPFAVDIHNYLRQKERKRYRYRGLSPQLSMRKATVEWMANVCGRMEFCVTVQHLAVYLLDIFMDNHTVHPDHLNMVTVGCLMIAVKLEEKDSLLPKNSDFNELLGNKYKLGEFVHIETSILHFFNWHCLYPTAAHFAEYYALYSLCHTDLHDNKPMNYDQVKVYVQKYIDYFLEVTLLDPDYLNFHPSLVGASCIAATRTCLLVTPPWSVMLQNVTFYKYAQIKPCADNLLRALDADLVASRKNSEKLPSNDAPMCESQSN